MRSGGGDPAGSDGAVVVGDAGHKGLGGFAARPFRAGQVLLRFRGRVVHRDELPALTPWEGEHLGELTQDTYQVLPPPRCYLNHACDANAVSDADTVYARRDIAAGEEVTLDYRVNAWDDGGVWEMACRCGAFPEAHVAVGDFFALPPALQAEYAPYAPAFIREAYRRRGGGGA
jgi:hypothetical protein